MQDLFHPCVSYQEGYDSSCTHISYHRSPGSPFSTLSTFFCSQTSTFQAANLQLTPTEQNYMVPPGSLTVRPWKYISSQKEAGSSSIPIMACRGKRALKLRGKSTHQAPNHSTPINQPHHPTRWPRWKFLACSSTSCRQHINPALVYLVPHCMQI